MAVYLKCSNLAGQCGEFTSPILPGKNKVLPWCLPALQLPVAFHYLPRLCPVSDWLQVCVCVCLYKVCRSVKYRVVEDWGPTHLISMIYSLRQQVLTCHQSKHRQNTPRKVTGEGLSQIGTCKVYLLYIPNTKLVVGWAGVQFFFLGLGPHDTILSRFLRFHTVCIAIRYCHFIAICCSKRSALYMSAAERQVRVWEN